jgi:3-oxoacyl-[acyl-carrier protein] reductase
MSSLLEGKRAIITGSSRGIGRSIALEFALQGADVVINYNKSNADAEMVASEVERLGRRAMLIGASVDDRAAVQGMIKQAEKEFGTVDIMVNNAGSAKDVFLMMMSDQAWNEVMDTNLKGTFYCCREVIRVMIKHRSGSIINIASLSGVSGRPGQCNYSASKGGVIAFTKSLAQEVGRFGIRVNAIAPGLIESSMTENLTPEILNIESIALRRLGAPEEVAKAAVFLASDMSAYTTGTVLHVNGGLYM